VSLVHNITLKENWNLLVKMLQKKTIVQCSSIPVIKDRNQKTETGTQILSWWKNVEQKSIALSLDYKHIFQTDIVDCYGSIYTHSVSWALHTKKEAKKKRNSKKLIGNIIDSHLQAMSNGQTNGIPQGSILMDLIAEIVLKYADKELGIKLKALINTDYKIIRYCDDYRIFVNNPENGKKIIKELSNVLAELGMKLNSQKTTSSDNVIKSSVKKDKLFWLSNEANHENITKQLLVISDFSNKYRNSGTLIIELQRFYKNIYNIDKFYNTEVLVAIIVDIAYNNPRTYPLAISIIGRFLATIKNENTRQELITKITKKFNSLPNTEIIDIWLQRLTIKKDKKRVYQRKLTKLVRKGDIEIWNFEWINEDLQKIVKETEIINIEEINTMDEYPTIEEVELFETKQIITLN
jgi:hypothetical protein